MKILRSMALSIWVWLKVDARPWLNRHTGLILLCVLLCMLGSCVYSCTAPPRSYQFLHDVSCIEKIELVQKEVDNGFANDPVKVLMKVDESDFPKIINAIQELPSRQYLNDPATGVGEYQIRIYYSTGEIEIIGNDNNVYVSPNGKWRRRRVHFEGDTLEELIINLLNEKSE